MNPAPLELPGVTLCAATSVNVEATVQAMMHAASVARFGAMLLFTDRPVGALPPGLQCVLIARLQSTADYSRFILHDLHRWIGTEHCMIVQWDGFPLHVGCWDPGFLAYDYIGAPWPQFSDGRDVGNGGFSLRSRRLLEACLAPGFEDDGSAEDLVIARRNREFLEHRHAIRFPDRQTAARFAIERPLGASSGQSEALRCAFGFHGVFNMVCAIGVDGFASIYHGLDHRTPLRTDLWPILAQLARTRAGRRLAIEMLRDRVRGLV